MLSHGNLTAADLDLRHADDAAAGPATPRTPRGDEIVIGVLPLFHIYALTTILLRTSGARQPHPAARPIRRGADAARHRGRIAPRHFPACRPCGSRWPTGRTSRQRDLSSLTYCGSGGAPLPVDVKLRFEKLTGHKLGGGWGMTETAPAGTNIPAVIWHAPAGDHRPADAGGRDGHRRPRRSASRASARRGRRTAHQGSQRHARLFQPAGGDRQPPSPMAISSPATSAIWTRTVSSSSSTARRT